MQIVWAQSVLYEPPAILGRKLNLFSPFHALILEAAHSPFMDDLSGKAAQVDDLLLAIHVCSKSFTDKFSGLINPQEIQDWGKSVTPEQWQSARADFSLYLKESWKTPEYWSSSSSAETKASWIFHLVVFAMKQLRFTEQQAWDAPISRIVCYRAAYAEQQTGESDLKTEFDEIGIETLKKDEEAAKEKAKKEK